MAKFFANKIASGLSHAFLRREWELSAITHMYRIPIMVDKMILSIYALNDGSTQKAGTPTLLNLILAHRAPSN